MPQKDYYAESASIEVVQPEDFRQMLLEDTYEDERRANQQENADELRLTMLHEREMLEDLDYALDFIDKQSSIREVLIQMKVLCKQYELDFKETLDTYVDSL